MAQQFCPKCKKTLDEGQFYTYKNGKKCEQCKKCETMHIDNYNPETFKWLLQKMDIPYIKEEWDSLVEKAVAKNGPHKPLTGMSVYGKYLSKMKLKQWMGYTWEDTDRLAADKANKMQGAMDAGIVKDADVLKDMYDKGEISEAEYRTLSEEPSSQPTGGANMPSDGYEYPANNPFEQIELIDVGADLTPEDKVYLAMKWGRLYRPDQWVKLEKFYHDMHDSFDIQGAAREDTLIKICKVSLQMDDAIDCRDTDTFQKLSRTYDTLMKSAKFTEAQRKDEGKGFVNSVGELVALCEKEESFIPRFDISTTQDIVDRTIADMNKYTYNLVTKEMGLGQQIEDALKKIQIQKEMEENEEFDGISQTEDDIMNEVDVTDDDFEEYFDEIRLQKEFDMQEEDE